MDIPLSGIANIDPLLDTAILSTDGELNQTESYSAAQVLEKLEVATSKADIRVSSHLMEMDRIRYIIADYIRCRIRKIEEFAQMIVSSTAEQTKLTSAELDFVTGYWASIKCHLAESAGKNMPENVRKINTDKIVVKPEYYKYVFVKAVKTETGVVVSEPGDLEEEIIDLDTNDQQLVPYKSIDHLLTSGAVRLI
ncbi:DNA replication complex GINS protein SLD5-like isoform X2 [Watersipora subatra]|uniref:DNA replication complex GINS protein SLD5-like isoform X2 n=1 Tax=Watersipora subatra TaxID=2589382 RepID=UPI00355BCE37